MKQSLSRIGFVAASSLCGAVAHAQVADLLNTFDAGSHSLGMGSSLTATDAETLSTYNNPAALGYLNHRTVGLSIENLPRSYSTVGDLNGDRTSSSAKTGPLALTNFGIAFPVSEKSNRGTIGISYNIGGYLDDSGSASQVPYGTSSTLVAAGYLDHLESRTDYFAVGYGKANAAQTLSAGISLLYAQESLQYAQKYTVFDTTNSTTVSTQDFTTSGTASGVGLVGGVEYIPSNLQSLTLGASIKSPIKLSGGNGVTSIYDTIPGRVLLGAGLRLPGLKKRTEDYAVFGAQFEDFFGGSGSGLLSLQNQAAGDFGFEYGYSLGDWIVPVRVGYRTMSPEGPAFADRNELTYGFGFKDKDGRYGIDFSWATPRNEARDFSITASYRFVNP